VTSYPVKNETREQFLYGLFHYSTTEKANIGSCSFMVQLDIWIK